MKHGNKLVLLSRAKINLTLEILFRRPDGYHELCSVMQELKLGDEITLADLPGSSHIELDCSDLELPRDENNLAFMAARLMQQEYGPGRGVSIKLVKKIPVAAGLGGGSSNAATVLLGLNKMWQLNLNHEQLIDLAARIGSDVPFFISGGTALALGRGEKLQEVSLFPPCGVLLAAPSGAKLSAAEVYSNVNLERIPANPFTGTATERLLAALSRAGQSPGQIGQLQQFLVNHLEESVLFLQPEVNHLKAKLREAGLPTLISGSGPTVFALAEDWKILRQLGQVLRNQGYRAMVTETIPGKELEKRSDT